MKNRFMVWLICSTSLTGFAQEFKAGFSLGFAPTQVEGDGLGGFDKYGISASGFVNRNFSATWLGQMDLKYLQKGSFDPNGTYQNYRMSLHYLEIPLTLFYRYKAKWLLGGGLAFGRLIKAQESNIYGDFKTRVPFKKNEISGQLAINYLFSERWSLGVRASQSIVPIRPHVGNVTFRYNRGQYNTVLDFTVGLLF